MVCCAYARGLASLLCLYQQGYRAEARLYVMLEPLILVCNNCGEQYGIDLHEFVGADEIACPACKQSDYYGVGNGFIIKA